MAAQSLNQLRERRYNPVSRVACYQHRPFQFHLIFSLLSLFLIFLIFFIIPSHLDFFVKFPSKAKVDEKFLDVENCSNKKIARCCPLQLLLLLLRRRKQTNLVLEIILGKLIIDDKSIKTLAILLLGGE